MSKFSLSIRLVLLVWATYRLASMVSSEEGPFSIFERLRENLGAYDYGENGKARTNLGRGISCPLCTGVYISGALLPLVFIPNRIGDWFLAWMGISGAQVFLENLTSDEAIQEAIQEVAESMEE